MKRNEMRLLQRIEKSEEEKGWMRLGAGGWMGTNIWWEEMELENKAKPFVVCYENKNPTHINPAKKLIRCSNVLK